MKAYKIIYFALMIISCTNGQTSLTSTVVREGGYEIHGQVDSEGRFQGEVTYYDYQSKKLIGKYLYVNGKKNGIGLTFHNTGQIRDSLYYVDGKEHGYFYVFHPNGELISRINYYYGLQVGPGERYNHGLVDFYRFRDFEKKFDVYECFYDSLGNFESASELNLHAQLNDGIVDNKKVFLFFTYLPRPPKMFVEYRFGLKNSKNEEIRSVEITNNVFLDTVVSYSRGKSYYFISCHMRDSSGIYNKYFITEFKTLSLYEGDQ